MTKTLESGEILINISTHTVYIEGKEVYLTPKEFALLCLFIKKRNLVLNKAFLSVAIWAGKYSNPSHTIERHIANLRKKLGSACRRIKTLPTIGYKYKEREDKDVTKGGEKNEDA